MFSLHLNSKWLLFTSLYFAFFSSVGILSLKMNVHASEKKSHEMIANTYINTAISSHRLNATSLFLNSEEIREIVNFNFENVNDITFEEKLDTFKNLNLEAIKYLDPKSTKLIDSLQPLLELDEYEILASPIEVNWAAVAATAAVVAAATAVAQAFRGDCSSCILVEGKEKFLINEKEFDIPINYQHSHPYYPHITNVPTIPDIVTTSDIPETPFDISKRVGL